MDLCLLHSFIRRFGFTNLRQLSSFTDGTKDGRDCRGEEHEIELIWSVKSGKTRVFWNGMNISHYFREEHLFEEVNFSWESRSGERFQIIARAKPCEDHPQYDLLIDGSSFFSLPRPSQLRAVDPYDVASEISVSSFEDNEERTQNSTDVEPTPDHTETNPQDVNVRFVMAGMSPSCEKPEVRDALEDELTSELFTNNLDSLRHRMTTMIPQIEDVVSRAIVNAFSDDPGSSSSMSSCSFDSMKPSPIHIEVNSVRDALSWMELNFDYAPRPDVEERKRLFLQKQVDMIFMHVRRENLSEDAAVRILCNVATLLGLELAVPLRKDTILIHGTDNHGDEEDMLCAMRLFGEISEAAMSKGRKFGICRFRDEQSVVKVMAASSSGTLLINGEAPIVLRVEYHPPRNLPTTVERAQSDPSPLFTKPNLVRGRSHQRNTITIDAVMNSAPFLTASDVDIPLVCPATSTGMSILQPNVFVNIPARSLSSRVFDSPEVSPQPSF